MRMRVGWCVVWTLTVAAGGWAQAPASGKAEPHPAKPETTRATAVAAPRSGADPRSQAASAAEAAARARRAQIEREVQRLGRLLASSSATTANQARRDLLDLAARERIAGLGYAVDKAHHELRRFWREHARRAARVHAEDDIVGLLEVRAQQTQLLGFDDFTTSLGTGSPVRLQLPRTRTTEVGTTVSVPLGGR